MAGTGTAVPCYKPHVEGGPVSWSCQQERDKSRTYRVKYKVRIDPAMHGPYTALNAGGLPLVGSVWNDAPSTAVVNQDVWAWFTAERSAFPWKSDKPEDNQYMGVECVATTKPMQDCLADGFDNPLAIRDRVRIETVNYQKEAVYDVDGFPILNSAWEQIRGHQVEFDNHRLRVYIEQYTASLELDLIQSLMHHLNDAALWGFDPRHVKLSHFDGEPRYYTNCTQYWLRRLVFDIADDFDRCVLDEGTKALRGKWDKNPASSTYGQYILGTNSISSFPFIEPVNPNNPRDFIQYQDWTGNPTRVILDGFGVPYDPIYGTGTARNIGQICIQYYDEGNLLLLGIPLSLE